MRPSFSIALLATYTVSALAQGFVCPPEDIIATQCMGPKDCVYPHPGNCRQFIHCEVNADGVTGRPTVKDCSDGLEWNDNEKRCDTPDQSTCASVVTKLLDTADEVIPPLGDAVDESFDCEAARSSQGCMGQQGPKLECIYENPKDSASFIRCSDGLAFVVPCDAGDTYQDAIKACE